MCYFRPSLCDQQVGNRLLMLCNLLPDIRKYVAIKCLYIRWYEKYVHTVVQKLHFCLTYRKTRMDGLQMSKKKFTTTLDETLIKEIKKLAIDLGLSANELIEEGIRLVLKRNQNEKRERTGRRWVCWITHFSPDWSSNEPTGTSSGIGFASVNQCGEHSAHLIPFSQMGPPSVYSGVRRAGGGFIFHPSHAANLPE